MHSRDHHHLYAGLMSGTSLDGIDVVLVDFNQQDLSRDIRHYHQPYPNELRQELLDLTQPGDNEIVRARDAGNSLAETYAAALNNLLGQHGIAHEAVAGLGCHGQTVRHEPGRKWTLQLVNAHLLAELVRIHVIYDFRSRDIARGGQGAPFAPLFHSVIFAQKGAATAVVNIGGISNLTVLPPADSEREPLAHDIGPGGILMDAWIQKHEGREFDENGLWASQGKPVRELLERMLAFPYFQQAAPKSTGRELFNLGWLAQFGVDEYPPADVQATLMELTARSITNGVSLAAQVERVVLSGGGALNAALCNRIKELLGQAKTLTSGQLGYPETWVEAAAFAYFAKLRLENKPFRTSSLTGSAPGEHIAGSVAHR